MPSSALYTYKAWMWCTHTQLGKRQVNDSYKAEVLELKIIPSTRKSFVFIKRLACFQSPMSTALGVVMAPFPGEPCYLGFSTPLPVWLQLSVCCFRPAVYSDSFPPWKMFLVRDFNDSIIHRKEETCDLASWFLPVGQCVSIAGHIAAFHIVTLIFKCVTNNSLGCLSGDAVGSGERHHFQTFDNCGQTAFRKEIVFC